MYEEIVDYYFRLQKKTLAFCKKKNQLYKLNFKIDIKDNFLPVYFFLNCDD